MTRREPFTCSFCGRRFYNVSAHTEECSGFAEGVSKSFLADGPCGARATMPERKCRLPYGHTGDHDYQRGL